MIHIDTKEVQIRQNLNGEFYVEVCEWAQREHWSHQFWSEDQELIERLAARVREAGSIDPQYWVNT